VSSGRVALQRDGVRLAARPWPFRADQRLDVVAERRLAVPSPASKAHEREPPEADEREQEGHQAREDQEVFDHGDVQIRRAEGRTPVAPR
jgi:hypothetical protein